ncbi:hypothetical protein JCM14244_07600 [Venenivibrio stagnispumantis]|uniref:Uncharacterized protein n=1 Tax=Venenivibrio stagnispumantis TaxID=407998 RepID=A0AA45WNT7_9AQUI|nr:hypothetical protein [Venenivibrio stagnispumantis]MCW4573926.1 hypothetical protein [Venenivibrio stagnispumantis]SMP18841.1 hypothetical protein SAMN06264868_11819 [Venenivibrio stagnispumantis]
MIDEKKLKNEIQNDEWQPVKNLEEEKIKLKNALIEKHKKKSISIKITENDIKKLKKKSLETGILYFAF